MYKLLVDTADVQPKSNLMCLRRTATLVPDAEDRVNDQAFHSIPQSSKWGLSRCLEQENKQASESASQCVIMNTLLLKEKQSYYQAEKDESLQESKDAVI